MNKKQTIKGFRQPYIDETVDKPEEPVAEREAVEAQLVALIFERYEPVATLPESTDQKTTIDLVDEMESTTEVSRSKVQYAMQNKGFKLHYSGSEYVWLLKER